MYAGAIVANCDQHDFYVIHPIRGLYIPATLIQQHKATILIIIIIISDLGFDSTSSVGF